MPHVRCSYCGGRRTLPKHPDEYVRALPRCRTSGCEGKRKRLRKPRRYRVDRYRDAVECGGQVTACTPGRGGCDGYPFPHRRGSRLCIHNPRIADVWAELEKQENPDVP